MLLALLVPGRVLRGAVIVAILILIGFAGLLCLSYGLYRMGY